MATNTKLPNNRNRFTGVLIVLLFGVVGTYLIYSGFALTPGASKVYLSSSTYNVPSNTSFDVQIRENSGSKPVNAVQINLSYPNDLVDLVSIDGTNSSFSVQAQSTDTNGVIMIARGSTSPRTGDQLIATLHFKSRTLTGNANLAFIRGTSIASASTNTNILEEYSNKGRVAATIAIAGSTNSADATPPAKPTGLTGKAEPGGYITLNWSPAKDDHKVVRYKVKLDDLGTVATVSKPTASLNSATPGRDYTYSVYAQDAAGNLSAPSDSITIIAR